jgi:hypothetical protein
MDTYISSITNKAAWNKLVPTMLGRLFYLATGLAVGWAVFHGRPSPADVGYNLFRKAHIAGDGGILKARVKAAGGLAKLKGSELWTVLLLLDVNNVDYSLTHIRITDPEPLTAGIESRVKQLGQRSEKGIIAEALKNVPEDANKAVLWAVTAMLLDTGRGGTFYYMDRFGPIRFTLRGGWTEPMQEIALDTLKRCVGVDYGYDPVLWREAILKKED